MSSPYNDILLICAGGLVGWWLQSIESRVRRLVRQVERLDKANSDRPGDVLFAALEDFLGVRRLTPQEIHARSEESEQLSEIEVEQAITQDVAYRTTAALTPPLRRVISFSMWTTREFTRDVVGVTDAELEELRDQAAPGRFWPSPGMTLQEWTTHTVVFDEFDGFSRYRKTCYNYAPRWHTQNYFFPAVLWSHTFGAKDEFGPTAGGSLEIVMHENTLKCWGREGRFGGKFRRSGGKYWFGDAEDQYVFITIPLDEEQLRPYLAPDEGSDDKDTAATLRTRSIHGARHLCMEPPDWSGPWFREYEHTDARGYGWNLVITDMLAYERS